MTEHAKLDATADLYVNVIEEDVACATPGDHCNCAVAQAIKRAVGRPDAEAVIFPSVAYVLMPADSKTIRAGSAGKLVKRGDLAWHRFRIGAALGSQILSFDETGDFSPEGYRFKAPTSSQKLSAKRARSKKVKQPGSRGPITARTPWRRSKHFRIDHMRTDA